MSRLKDTLLLATLALNPVPLKVALQNASAQSAPQVQDHIYTGTLKDSKPLMTTQKGLDALYAVREADTVRLGFFFKEPGAATGTVFLYVAKSIDKNIPAEFKINMFDPRRPAVFVNDQLLERTDMIVKNVSLPRAMEILGAHIKLLPVAPAVPSL